MPANWVFQTWMIISEISHPSIVNYRRSIFFAFLRAQYDGLIGPLLVALADDKASTNRVYLKDVIGLGV